MYFAKIGVFNPNFACFSHNFGIWKYFYCIFIRLVVKYSHHKKVSIICNKSFVI